MFTVLLLAPGFLLICVHADSPRPRGKPRGRGFFGPVSAGAAEEGSSVHQRSLDLDLVFPMKDGPSARLMRLKAELLYRAGIIDHDARAVVFAKADAVLERDLAGSSRVLARAPRRHSAGSRPAA